MGDLLFSVVNLCRFLKLDAESALRGCTARFAERFAFIEHRLQDAGIAWRDCSLEQLDAIWAEAKQALQPGGQPVTESRPSPS